jgi:membrane-associated protein
MTDQLLAALSVYGLPVLFAVIVIASVGLPFPMSLLLVAAGSFAEQGDMQLPAVMAVATAGAILGDNIGYFIARQGGRRFLIRLGRSARSEHMVERAEEFSQRWGAAGIFFSRWLVTPLGSWINFTSGVARYSWKRFFIWVSLGEAFWVLIYVGLGYTFSDRVQTLVDVLGNFVWALVGLLLTGMLGSRLVKYLRNESESDPTTIDSSP